MFGKVYFEVSVFIVIEKEVGLIMDWNFIDNENFIDFDNSFCVFFVVVGILIICGIFENVMICWILISKKKYLRSFVNFYLLNLVIIDILF